MGFLKEVAFFNSLGLLIISASGKSLGTLETSGLT